MHPEPNPPKEDGKAAPDEGPDEMFRFEKIMKWNAEYFVSAEEVLVGQPPKVLGMQSRIIFFAASEIRAYYIVYSQRLGRKIKDYFSTLFPNTYWLLGNILI